MAVWRSGCHRKRVKKIGGQRTITDSLPPIPAHPLTHRPSRVLSASETCTAPWGDPLLRSILQSKRSDETTKSVFCVPWYGAKERMSDGAGVGDGDVGWSSAEESGLAK